MCELIHLTTNGLLSAFPPSQVATGTGPSTLNVSIHDVFVCGGEPLAFFENELQTLCIFARARASPRRPKGGLSGGAHGPPRCPLHLSRVVLVKYMLMMLLLIFCHHCATFSLPTAHDFHLSVS